MTESILDAAKALITGDRAQEYGHPSINLTRIATLWGAYLKAPITASDVAALMILLKIARLRTGVGTVESIRDTITDIAGYAGLIQLIEEHEPCL